MTSHLSGASSNQSSDEGSSRDERGDSAKFPQLKPLQPFRLCQLQNKRPLSSSYDNRRTNNLHCCCGAGKTIKFLHF